MVDGPLPGGEGPGDYGPVLEPTGPRDGAEYHEKSPVPARDRRQPMLPLRPGLPEPRTSDYERHGTSSLFAALDVATGQVMGRCHRRHRHPEFPPISFHGLSRFPTASGCQGSPCGAGPLRNPPDPQGDSLVCAASARSSAFHAEQRVLDQSGGGLVCGTHREADSARVLSERGEPGEGHSGVFGPLQRKSEAVCVDGVRGPDPGQNPATCKSNFYLIRDTVQPKIGSQRIHRRIPNSGH